MPSWPRSTRRPWRAWGGCAAGAPATSRAARTAPRTPWPTRPWTASRPAAPRSWCAGRARGSGPRRPPAWPTRRPMPATRQPGAAVPRTRRAAARDQLPLGLEPGFDPGDPGPEAGELRVRILGSGTSQGLPRIACDCATCTSADPRDRRLRASALLAWGARRVVVDCGPDFRAQALAADLDRLDAVLLTHEHQDAIGGLDDLRRFNEIAGDYLPVYGAARDAGGGGARGSPTPSCRAGRASAASRCCARWPSRAPSRSPAAASCPCRSSTGSSRRPASGPAGSATSPTSSGSRRRRWRSCATWTSWSSTRSATRRTRPTRPSPRRWP